MNRSQQCLGPLTKGEKPELGPQEGHGLPGETSCIYTEENTNKGSLCWRWGRGAHKGLREGGIAWARGSGMGSQIKRVRSIPPSGTLSAPEVLFLFLAFFI